LNFFEEINSFDQDVERAVHDAGTDAGFGAAGARCLPGHVQQVAISFFLLCSGVALWAAICSFIQSINFKNGEQKCDGEDWPIHRSRCQSLSLSIPRKIERN
jgi:hypothetical protein